MLLVFAHSLTHGTRITLIIFINFLHQTAVIVPLLSYPLWTLDRWSKEVESATYEAFAAHSFFAWNSCCTHQAGPREARLFLVVTNLCELVDPPYASSVVLVIDQILPRSSLIFFSWFHPVAFGSITSFFSHSFEIQTWAHLLVPRFRWQMITILWSVVLEITWFKFDICVIISKSTMAIFQSWHFRFYTFMTWQIQISFVDL